ncbi:aminoglycoside phosphotransferase [Parafrankia sp. EAN1pec]|uniref:phosphotransferase family protein n=1 Tax=Parafrankia sp. (strain EAN1pec) TaxID=298653 RepID=UPI000054341E|nr:aminoglycoside phosphotransferase [Frankia sp. EAN1pec]
MSPDTRQDAPADTGPAAGNQTGTEAVPAPGRSLADAEAQLAVRVRARLAARHPGVEIGLLTPLVGGRSGLTYAVRAGADGHVVKAVPPGQRPIGRNDVLRQAVVLRALAPTGLPVPEVTASEETPPAWFAMSFADGAAVEPVLDIPPGGPLPGPLARARMLTAASLLGRLHAVGLPMLAEGLRASGAELPEPLTPARELERWTRTMHAVPAELRPGSAELLAQLARKVPEPVATVLVHGDFRLGNLLFVGTEPTALVDWEIWSIGDPRVDLGWFGVFRDAALFPGVGHPVPGLPTEDELVSTYRAAGGAELGPAAEMTWFRALGRMKMAAIMGHNLRRHREGRHHDPVQELLPPTIAALIGSARALLAGD